MRPGVLLFEYELLHAFVVHFWITRFQNRLSDVTGCFELMISSNFTWYYLVLKLTRRCSPVIYFRVKNVMLN